LWGGHLARPFFIERLGEVVKIEAYLGILSLEASQKKEL
jgi:hypothetical protein